ncbi:MAG: RcpC/CpaB family pilus assembly protein [Chloroflexota bacterium]
MEMEFKDNKGRRRVALVFGVALAIGAGGLAFAMSGGKQSASADPATSTMNVVVAAAQIPAGTKVDASYLTMRAVPKDASNALGMTDAQTVIGLTTAVDVLNGQVITPNLFTTASANEAFAIISPTETIGPDTPNWRAVAVDVQDLNAVGGLLKPGQHVDLVASMLINVVDPNAGGDGNGKVAKPGPVPGLSAKVTITDAEILAHTDLTTVYVLKVDAHQGEEIAFLQNQNPYFRGFSMMLRAPSDDRVLPRDGYGVTGDRVLLKYGFPLEQAIIGDRYPQPSPEPVALDATPAPAEPAASIEPSMAPAPSEVPEASPVPVASPAPAASPASVASPAA